MSPFRQALHLALLTLGIWHLDLNAQESQAIHTVNFPMTAERWEIVPSHAGAAKPDIQFTTQEGFPDGLLVVKSGSAALKSFDFQDGTIEFDFKALKQDIPGIEFRRQGSSAQKNAEEVYVRTLPDCRASNDCIQYTPIIHGFMLWNAYPQYQAQAFILDGWNHVKLVISGKRMNVYVNWLPTPVLTIGHLESESRRGGIAFHDPAIYANLRVMPDAVEGLTPRATSDPAASDAGYVHLWQLGPATSLQEGQTPAYADMPKKTAHWDAVHSGRFGFVNLTHNFHLDLDNPPPLAWIRTTVRSSSTQSKRLSMGWSGGAWIFVNGKLVAEGKNYYNAASERRMPDGRISTDNGSFDIPLKAGDNEVVVALYPSINDNRHSPNRYGWGVEMKFDDPQGLKLNLPSI